MLKAKSINSVKTPIIKKTKDDESLSEFASFVSQTPKKRKGRAWLAITLIVVIILLATAWFFSWRSVSWQKEYKFKAIYLDNDQVYYAKVVREDSLSIYLDDVYYIQMEEQTIPATEEGAEAQKVSVPVLVKRGQELHQPTGWMQLNRDKVIAVEEIGLESEILKEINRQETQP